MKLNKNEFWAVKNYLNQYQTYPDRASARESAEFQSARVVKIRIVEVKK